MRIWLVHDKSSWMDDFRSAFFSLSVFKTQGAKTILKRKEKKKTEKKTHAHLLLKTLSYAHACPKFHSEN